jgi:hypothetical protein
MATCSRSLLICCSCSLCAVDQAKWGLNCMGESLTKLKLHALSASMQLTAVATEATTNCRQQADRKQHYETQDNIVPETLYTEVRCAYLVMPRTAVFARHAYALCMCMHTPVTHGAVSTAVVRQAAAMGLQQSSAASFIMTTHCRC